MKKNILFSLLALTGYAPQAQEVATPAPRTHNKEIGIFGQQTLSSSGDNSIAMMGVQFKKWKNPHYGFRVIAAYGGYSSSNNFYTNRYQVITPDTIIEKYHTTDIGMGILGFGVEAQRVFYKRIVLFTALEVRGGYGSGKQDEYQSTRYGTQDSYYENSFITDTRDANMVYIAVAPTIGAKVQFTRLNVGLEMTGINMSYKGIKVDGIIPYDRYNTGDFSLGEFTHRVFVNYNF